MRQTVMGNQCSMLLFWISLLVIGTTSKHVSHYKEKKVSEICDNIRCPYNRVCRVVRHCHRPQCHPEFACIPCVPEGVDVECNLRNYTHSVLFGDPLKPRTLIPLDCSFGETCPYGSTCAKHPDFIHMGNCCYGPSSDLPVENEDKKCLLCVPECDKGFYCEEVKDRCEESYNVCKPKTKHGRCPRPRRKWCRFGRKKTHQCPHDQACPGAKKCCKTTCGGFQCRYPIREFK